MASRATKDFESPARLDSMAMAMLHGFASDSCAMKDESPTVGLPPWLRVQIYSTRQASKTHGFACKSSLLDKPHNHGHAP